MSLTLDKGATISLKKANSDEGLSSITLGLGWDPVRGGGLFRRAVSGDIDLDASAILLDRSKREVGIIYYGNLDSQDRSIHHNGDNLTGDGDGDDEQIRVDLNAVSSQVETIVLVITSYSGHKFNTLENVFTRVVDNATGQETVRYNLAQTNQEATAKIVAKISREGSGWKFTAIGEDAQAKTPNKLVARAQELA